MELDEDSETSTHGLQNRCSAAELIQLIKYSHFLTLAFNIKHGLHALPSALTLPTPLPRPCLIVLQRFGFRSLCRGELKPWYRLMPRYPTFTGICDLVLFHQLWVSRFSVDQCLTFKHENPNRRSGSDGWIRTNIIPPGAVLLPD